MCFVCVTIMCYVMYYVSCIRNYVLFCDVLCLVNLYLVALVRKTQTYKNIRCDTCLNSHICHMIIYQYNSRWDSWLNSQICDNKIKQDMTSENILKSVG